jgi:site-specific recombinase XerD
MHIKEYTIEYLHHQKINQGVCFGTINKYSEGFRKIDKTLGNPNVLTINQNTIFEWMEKLDGLSANRKRFLVGLFRNFMGFLKNTKKLDVLDCKEIALPKPENKPVRYLAVQEVEEIIMNLSEKTICDLRFKALFCLLASSGARINEVLNLRIEDVDFENREALVLGKGSRYRKIFFDERAKFNLNQYLSKR